MLRLIIFNNNEKQKMKNPPFDFSPLSKIDPSVINRKVKYDTVFLK